jgi:hypothetical protein
MFRRGLFTVIGFAVVVLAFVIGFAVYPVGAIWLGGIALPGRSAAGDSRARLRRSPRRGPRPLAHDHSDSRASATSASVSDLESGR